MKTNIPFLENIIADDTFRAGQAHTKLIDTKASLFEFSRRRDRATRTLAYLSEITVNGNPHAKGYRPTEIMLPAALPKSLITTTRTRPKPSSRARPRKVHPVDPKRETLP